MTENQKIMVAHLESIHTKMNRILGMLVSDSDCMDLFNSTDSYPFAESFDDVVQGMENFIDELKGDNDEI
jgi:hypothetical protein